MIDSPQKGTAHTMTNLYGLKVENQTAGGTKNWAIHTGTGQVQLGDALSVGSWGYNQSAIWAEVGTLEGVYQYGASLIGYGNSEATSEVVAVFAKVQTQNASFTTALAAGLHVYLPSKGASNTITTLYGIKVENQAVGGTNYAIHTGTGTTRLGDAVSIAGNVTFESTDGPAILNEDSSGTNPVFIPDKDDFTTGIGSSGNGLLDLIAGGTQALQVSATQTTIINKFVTYTGVSSSFGGNVDITGGSLQWGGGAVIASSDKVMTSGSVVIYAVASGSDLAVEDGVAYVTIPANISGKNLVKVHARVLSAGTTGTTDIQIRNVTDAQDMLSTKLTIDSTEVGSNTAATPPVINGTYDDVAEYDLLAIDVDAVSTTPPTGLIVTLTFA